MGPFFKKTSQQEGCCYIKKREIPNGQNDLYKHIIQKKNTAQQAHKWQKMIPSFKDNKSNRFEE